jgi:hypothetical protein
LFYTVGAGEEEYTGEFLGCFSPCGDLAKGGLFKPECSEEDIGKE